jgi:hypothetical protein
MATGWTLLGSISGKGSDFSYLYQNQTGSIYHYCVETNCGAYPMFTGDYLLQG